MTIQVEQISIHQIIPYINNARTHSEAQVAQIAASIREFGFNNPILIDENETIIAGHGRFEAAQKLNLEEVPCIRLTHLTENQRKAYVLADNKLALNAGWDEELLKLELGELGDLTGLVGFTVEEINVLMNGWQSDIDLAEKHGTNLDGIESAIKISVSQDSKEWAKEVITNALDSAGIEYEYK